MPASTLHILLIGDTSRPEFLAACTALEELAHVTRFADVEVAIAMLSESVGCGERSAGKMVGPARSPTLGNASRYSGSVRATHRRDGASVFHSPYGEAHGIVLAQAYPGQFSVVAIDRLRSLTPLARLIAILGSWCEGEPRSGHPLPGAIRMYWHEAAIRLRRELPRWVDGTRPATRERVPRCPVPATFEGQGSAWQLPATASDEERLLASVRAPLAQGRGLVALWTRRPEMEGLLSEACRRAGYSTAWLHPRQPARVQGAVAAVYDGDSLNAAGLAELGRLAAEVSPAPVLALLDAPRVQDVRLARTLGAAVLAKPFRIDELLWLLPR